MKGKIVYLILIVLSFCACQEDRVENENGEGWLAIEFLTDKSVRTRATEPEYQLRITNSQGKEVAHYDNFKGLSDRILLPAGTYTLVATSGEDVVADFEKPYYKAEQEVNIEAAVTKQVSLICTQANVKVTVEYSDLIKSHFPEYTLKVVNGEGSLTFIKDEKRSGYLRVNEGTLVWHLTLNNGQEVFRLNKTITGVEPRQHYHFSFDIKENGSEDEGAFVGGVVVDTTTDIYNWLCEIVLKENIAKPEIRRLDGGAMSESVLVLEKARGADVQLDITAQARIQNLKLRHKSSVLKELGIPEVVTITEISPAVKDAVQAAGILWDNQDVLNSQQVTLNFNDLINNKLPLGDYEFFVSVYDARSRLVEDTLRISVIPDMDHVALNDNRYNVWAKFATISGQWYTVERPAGMTLEYSKDQNSWTKVNQEDIQFDDAMKSLTVCLTHLDPGTLYYYRTVSDNFVSDQVKSFTTEEAPVVPYLSFDNCYNDKGPVVGESKDNIIWDSGNKGGNSFGFTPTTQETNDVIKGSAVRMESMWAAVKFAAGNIYTGSFGGTYNVSQAKINFGIPYTGRPTTLSGYYKYAPQTVNRGEQGGMSGKQDSCHIYIALLDWTAPHVVDSKYPNTNIDLSVNNKSIIAFGEVKDSRTMTNYEAFNIQLDYRDKEKIPSYILIVATASKYGDYFTGAEGSVLLIDEFELGFDPVE